MTGTEQRGTSRHRRGFKPSARCALTRAGSRRATLLCIMVLGTGCSDTGNKRDGGGKLLPTVPVATDGGAAADTCTGSSAYSAFVADPRLCVFVYARDLKAPRQMAFARNGDLFVNAGAVTVLWDANADGTSDSSERAKFASASGLGHGVALDREQRFVYASSMTAVYRWPYERGLREAKQAAELVIKNIPEAGHNTRTLQFDSRGRLYVSVGSASNVDDSEPLWNTRSQIRRFALPVTLAAGGVEYMQGEVVASGMRNEVGLFVDAQDRLWGVENGRDNLEDTDFGGDIHNDNPGEEINLVDGKGPTFYGYPFCYSEFKLDGGQGAGAQWADQTLDSAIRKTDAWCRDPANVRAPAFAMQGHFAPLGIIQYTGTALPFTSDFIITAHGSWNRSPPVGRLLARARYQDGAITSVEPIVGEKSSDGRLKQGSWDARPVDVQQGPDQALYFSDDLGGRVFKVGYRP
jgi:glucose/arabinose dehydrogenase